MARRVHEVEHVGLLPLVLHQDGDWGAFEADLTTDLITPIVRPLVLPIQVPAVLAARWSLVRVLNDHVAEQSFTTVKMATNAD